jgi:hypothetical protein
MPDIRPSFSSMLQLLKERHHTLQDERNEIERLKAVVACMRHGEVFRKLSFGSGELQTRFFCISQVL